MWWGQCRRMVPSFGKIWMLMIPTQSLRFYIAWWASKKQFALKQHANPVYVYMLLSMLMKPFSDYCDQYYSRGLVTRACELQLSSTSVIASPQLQGSPNCSLSILASSILAYQPGKNKKIKRPVELGRYNVKLFQPVFISNLPLALCDRSKWFQSSPYGRAPFSSGQSPSQFDLSQRANGQVGIKTDWNNFTLYRPCFIASSPACADSLQLVLTGHKPRIAQ